ncbi:MAG: hypothetical protein HYU43_00935 [Armatimonadetes bacterium]|nr:hypothetical protein [Planctomycetota bacterium]MBI2200491.1 hypothetical protein [Armatimonadota bacterium]
MIEEYLPKTNADGLPIIPMTESQKYIFDLKGWLLLPGLLTGEQLGSVRAHQMKYLHARESLPPHERDNHGGPSEILLDHPVVVGVLNEILSHQDLASEEAYGFRFDHTYTSLRRFGQNQFNPHGGGSLFNFCGNSHIYQHLPGRVHAGLTRVVWELNDVEQGKGGTLFISGSHKAAFPRPEEVSGHDSPLWETYGCPPGSVVVFTEAICHSGTPWLRQENDRLSLFTCYNTVNSKWGKGCPAPAVIAAMKPKRQTLFRGAWCGMGEGQGINRYYEEANRAV